MNGVIAKNLESRIRGVECDDWKIVELVNFGKSAAVFKAERDGNLAAVKVFDPELVESFGVDVTGTRIERQLTLIGERHPNLVQILGGGHQKREDLWFVVMEYLEYPDLETVLADVRPNQIAPIISQLAEAAHFLLERHNLAHRDIKPANVAVDLDLPHAVLLDLGVIRPIGDSDITDEEGRKFIGTLRYSSPEFLARREEDSDDGWAAVTFYQLGAVLHDLVMKHPIFANQSEPFARLVKAIEYDEPDVNPSDEYPPEIVQLTKNCLVKNPVTRLDLVKWEDFRVDRLEPGRSAAIDRIKQRALSARDAAGSPDLRDEFDRRRITQLAMSVRAELGGMIHNSLTHPLYPPHEIHEHADREIFILLGQADHVGFPYYVGALLDVLILDAPSKAIAIEASAAASSVAIDYESYLKMEPPRMLVFRGVFETKNLMKLISGTLINLIEQGQEMSGKISDTSLRALQVTTTTDQNNE